jgi:hypothetical protein
MVHRNDWDMAAGQSPGVTGPQGAEHMKHLADRKWHLRPWWMFWRKKWRRWEPSGFRGFHGANGGDYYTPGHYVYQSTKQRAFDALREAVHGRE